MPVTIKKRQYTKRSEYWAKVAQKYQKRSEAAVGDANFKKAQVASKKDALKMLGLNKRGDRRGMTRTVVANPQAALLSPPSFRAELIEALHQRDDLDIKIEDLKKKNHITVLEKRKVSGAWSWYYEGNLAVTGTLYSHGVSGLPDLKIINLKDEHVHIGRKVNLS